MTTYKKRFGKVASFYLNDLIISESQAEQIITPLVNILYRLNIQYPRLLGYEIFDKGVHILEDENSYQLVFVRQIRKNNPFIHILKGKKKYERYLTIDINKNTGFFRSIDDINNYRHEIIELSNEEIQFIPRYSIYSTNNEMAKDILLTCLRASSFSNELIDGFHNKEYDTINSVDF
ncbi:TPA: hypothetical protein ACS7YQ_003854 [Providencia alcalifaciens]